MVNMPICLFNSRRRYRISVIRVYSINYIARCYVQGCVQLGHGRKEKLSALYEWQSTILNGRDHFIPAC